LHTLTGLELLRRLDLSRTKVTNRRVQAAIRSLPALEWVGVAGLRVGWLSRWRLRALLRGREAQRKRLQLLSPSS
jgi:hypothetical protein